MKPSDLTAVRDESTAGQARRAALWIVLGLSLWIVPLLALAIGAGLEGRMPTLLVPGDVVRSTVSLVTASLHEPRAPWWQALPHPGHSPHGVGTLAVGLVVGIAVYAALASWAWNTIARRTGFREYDRQRRRQMDGAGWAEHHDVHHLLTTSEALGDRVVLGTPRAPRAPGKLVAVEPGHSALVVAPTGQGKTESVIAPAILDWDGPVVCCSIKRDVYDHTAGHRARLGETRVLDPTGLTDPYEDRNAYWTPIPEARSWRAARTLADQMCGVGLKGAQSSGNEDYFANAAGELLSGLLFAAAHSPDPSMNTVHDWLTHPGRSMRELDALMGDMLEDAELDADTRMNAPHALAAIRLRMVGKDPRSVEAIRTTVGNAIRAWNEWRFAHATPDDPGVLAPDWLWAEPSKWERPGSQRTLYVIGPDADQDTYRGMFVGAITQIYNAYARAGQGRGTRPAKRLLIVLDEVANMTPIPNLDRWVTAARGLGINLVLATQNLAQLDTVWGREKAETIASGPRVRMFGPGIADRQTLEYVEKVGGQTALLTDTVSRSPYGLQIQTQRSTNTQWRPLIQQQELRELQPHTGIVLYGTTPPFTVDWRSAQTDLGLLTKTGDFPVPPDEDERRHLRDSQRTLRQSCIELGTHEEPDSGAEDLVDFPLDWQPSGVPPRPEAQAADDDEEADG